MDAARIEHGRKLLENLGIRTTNKTITSFVIAFMLSCALTLQMSLTVAVTKSTYSTQQSTISLNKSIASAEISLPFRLMNDLNFISTTPKPQKTHPYNHYNTFYLRNKSIVATERLQIDVKNRLNLIPVKFEAKISKKISKNIQSNQHGDGATFYQRMESGTFRQAQLTKDKLLISSAFERKISKNVQPNQHIVPNTGRLRPGKSVAEKSRQAQSTNDKSNILDTFEPQISKKEQPNHCKDLVSLRNKSVPIVSKSPPWFDLMKDLNSTINSTKTQQAFYLTVQNIGRLGNQMFEYASLFGIAWRNSMIPLWNKDPHGLRKIFNQLRIDANHNGPNRNASVSEMHEKNWLNYMEATERLPPCNILVNGYLQHKRYFAHVEDQLRYEFTFSSDVIRQAQRKLAAIGATSLREQGYVRVVIHVRRGDYSGVLNTLLKSQPDFFERSMASFTDCLPKVHFIVISDERFWARRNLFGHRVDFIDGERSPAVDLAIASLCDHAIITVGTFSWWVAWFANGVTVELTQKMELAKRPSVGLNLWKLN